MTTRSSFFNSSGVTAYDNSPAVFKVFKVGVRGEVQTAAPVATFTQMQVVAANEEDSEKTQIALSSDAPKLYSFGRQHRIFNYQGFLADSDLRTDVSINIPQESVWTGRSYTEWQQFYENYAKLSVCADKRYLVQLTHTNKRILGALNMMAATGYAEQPHKYDVTFSFYATSVEDVDVL